MQLLVEILRKPVYRLTVAERFGTFFDLLTNE